MDDLMAFRSVDVFSCNAEKLVDLRDVKINRKEPLRCRADSFAEKVGNPYLFKVDDITVKIEFVGNKNFSEILIDFVLSG